MTQTHFSYSDNFIGNDGMKSIATGLETNSTLVSIHLKSTNYLLFVYLLFAGNEIGAEGAKALAKALLVNNTVTAISLDGVVSAVDSVLTQCRK